MNKLPDKTYYIFFSLITLGLYLLRVWKLEYAGLYDYDSVKNYQIAREMMEGNFQELYHHASPFFNLFLWLLVSVFNDFLFPEYINAAISIIALIVLSGFAKKEIPLNRAETLLFYSLCGTSLTMVNISRYLAIEGLTLLISILVIKYFYEWIRYKDNHKLKLTALLFGTLLTINYKALLLLPVLILFIGINKIKIEIKQILYASLIALIPFVALMITGVFMGQPLLKFPKYFAGNILRSGIHPEKQVGIFDSDWLFYIKYFFYYENPLLILVLLIFPLFFYKHLKIRKDSPFALIAVISYCFLFGMSLLPKAPRGLLFAYPFLYLMMFLIIRSVSKKVVVTFIITLFVVILNIYSIVRNIYPYAYSSYPVMAEEVRKMKVNSLASTVSNRIYPFIVKDSVDLKVLLNKNELKVVGSDYLLDDAYRKVTNITFDTLSALPSLISFKEPTMLSPLFVLEHAEYSGMSFEEALRVRDSLVVMDEHIRLIKICQ